MKTTIDILKERIDEFAIQAQGADPPDASYLMEAADRAADCIETLQMLDDVEPRGDALASTEGFAVKCANDILMSTVCYNADDARNANKGILFDSRCEVVPVRITEID